MLLLLLSAAWARQVIVEVDLGPVTMAPMVQLRSGPDSLELRCSDDGRLPDRAGDDDIATCSGEALPSGEWRVEVRAEQTRSFTVQVADEDPVQIRVDRDGARLERWAVEAAATEPEPEPEAQREPQPQESGRPPEPGSQAPRTTGGSLAWSVLGAFVALGVGLLVGRGRRGLPSSLSWPEKRVLEVRELPSLQGVVLSVGPVHAGLRVSSEDVLDVLEALHGLRRSQPAAALNLVLSTELQNPGDVGLTALERLLADAPEGTTVYLVG